MYFYGQYVDKDIYKAEELIKKSINLGYLEGYSWLYYIYQDLGDYKKSAELAKVCFEATNDYTCKYCMLSIYFIMTII